MRRRFQSYDSSWHFLINIFFPAKALVSEDFLSSLDEIAKEERTQVMELDEGPKKEKSTKGFSRYLFYLCYMNLHLPLRFLPIACI